MEGVSLISLLQEYAKNSPVQERELVKEFQSYISSNSRCFERKRENDAKHIAASILLITPDFKKALFLWHAKIQRWTQPGGHADGDSDLHRVALKELEEETGITNAKLVSAIPLDIYRFDYSAQVFGYRKSIYNVWFTAILPKNQKPRIMEREKCEKICWATHDEALRMINEVPHTRTRELIYKWKALADKKIGADTINSCWLYEIFLARTHK